MDNCQVVKFGTLEACEEYQALQYAADIAAHDDPEYTAKTIAHDVPRQRTDGDWTVFVCEHCSTEGQTVIDYDPADYPEPEME